MRLRPAAVLGLALAFTGALASCGTVGSLLNKNDTKLFGGVVVLTTVMIPTTNHNMWLGCIFIPDLPVSLVADIILLPLTIPWEIMRAAEKRQESREARPSGEHVLMEIRFPVGSSRAAIVAKYGAPKRILDLPGKDPGPYIRRAASALQREGRGVPVRCEEYTVLRETLGSSLGAFGMYVDYVFYDAQGVVLGASRRFVD